MSVHMKRDVENLHKRLLTLSAHVEDSLRIAVEALESRNAALAAEVLDLDDTIDAQEVEIEEQCLKILALYHPVAGDLRVIVGTLKINNDLERIGDIAVNIAERADFIATRPPVSLGFDFPRMAALTRRMLNSSLNAMVKGEPALAIEVCQLDDDVDAMNREVFALSSRAMASDPQNIESYMAYLSVSKHLERIADMATSIAKDVIYMETGEITRHKESQVLRKST